MKQIIFYLFLILLITSCRSVRKTTVDIRQEKDSVNYSSVTTVKLDTIIIPQDTATLEALIDITGDGRVVIEEIKQDQGQDISLDYSIEKMATGATKIKVKATTKPKEILAPTTTIETTRHVESSDIRQVENTKKVKGISMWHLAWVIPLVLIGIVIYLKRKTIMKYLPF